MNTLKILAIIGFITTSTLLPDDHYGYVERVTNNYSNGVLYLKNTDPNPGAVNNRSGGNIFAVQSGQTITNFNNYAAPWDAFGGKIYAWVVDNQTGALISAVKIYDSNNNIMIENDSAMNPKNTFIFQRKDKESCTMVDVRSGKRSTSNVTITITVDRNGIITQEMHCNR